jgi:hypothetical protein
MFMKQEHQHVSLICRKTWPDVNNFSEACNQIPWQNKGEDYILLGHLYTLVDTCLVWETRIDAGIKQANVSWCPHIFYS